MRKVGVNYAFWCKEWDADVRPLIARTAKAGFDQLEIGGGITAGMSESELKDFVNAAADYGLTVSYGLSLDPENDLTSDDPEIRKSGVKFLTDLIKKVGSVGGKTISGSVYSAWPGLLPEGECREKYFDYAVEGMKAVAPVAEDAGVELLCEAQNRFEHFIINTSEQGVAFCKAVGSPAVRLLLDTFHMNIEEDSFQEAILSAGSYLGGMHLGEANRRPVGEGRLPWDAMKAALDKIGFTGALVEEPFVQDRCGVGRSVRLWRPLYDELDLDRIAAASADFMKRVLA